MESGQVKMARGLEKEKQKWCNTRKQKTDQQKTSGDLRTWRNSRDSRAVQQWTETAAKIRALPRIQQKRGYYQKDLRDTIKRPNITAADIPGGTEREVWVKDVFSEIIIENSLNTEKELRRKIKEVHRILNRVVKRDPGHTM